MSDTTRKDDELRMEIIRKTSTRMSLSDVDIVMQIVRQYGVQERIDEHSLWKPVAKEIVTKDGVYRAVNFLNQRAQELTALKDKQETK